MKPYSNTLSRTVSYRLPVIACCIGIFRQSSYPSIMSEPLFPHSDKLIHFFVYAFLAFLCARDLTAEKQSWSAVKIKIISIVFASAFGLSDEIHQAFVPDRCASFFDFLADCGGSIFGSFLYLGFIPWKYQ